MEKPLNLKEDPDEGDGDDGKEEDNKPDGTITAASNAKDDCSDLTDNNNDAEEQAPKSFPQRLMDILSNESYQEIISWLPHGTGFQIHKKKTFANDILPHYFKASKFTSFTRKLNRWGFSRIPRGPETGAYFHKLFRRDKPELCLQMTSNSGNKYQSNPMHQQLLPNGPGGMVMPAAAMPGIAMPAMFPYMPNPMMAGMTPQQQHAMWQQQMQQMMLFQQQQMMQMQQSQMGNMMGNPMMGNMMGGPMGLMMAGGGGGGLPTSPMNGSAGGGEMNNNNKNSSAKDESDAAAENTEEETNKPAEEEV